MEEPYIIASLAAPLDAEHGRIQAAPVHGFRELTKRKRHEVVVGIDGEDLHIFNIQTQASITSYALPPQSYLACAPASTYLRATSSTQARRKTYIVTKNGANDLKRQLVCFSENATRRKVADGDLPKSTRQECKLPKGEIVDLAVLPPNSDADPTVLVTYKNGRIEFIKGDLSQSQHQDMPRINTTHAVEYSTLLDSTAAKRSILKNREDIATVLDEGISSASVNALLLCRLTRSDEGKTFDLCKIRDPYNQPLHTTRPPIQDLLRYTLPSPSNDKTRAAKYDLHTQSGMLYQLSGHKLNVYDLSGTTPKLINELGNKSAPIQSFARISQSSILTFSGQSATLFETVYGSVQNSISIPELAPSNPTRKRKREDEESQSPSFQAISTFRDAGLVVGMSANHLRAIRFSDIDSTSRAIRSKSTLLVDVLGKGSLKDKTNRSKAAKKSKKWKEWTTGVDALIAAGDIQGLEKLVANDEKLGKQRKSDSRLHHTEDQDAGVSNNDATAYEQLWPLPETFDPEEIDRRKALYILFKVFEPDATDPSKVEVAIESPRLLEWFALAGLLSADHLRQAAGLFGVQQINIHAGSILCAIRGVDDDFQLIHNLLTLPVHWEIAEVVQALRLLLESFDVAFAESHPSALPAPSIVNGEVDMVNGDAESHLELEANAAEHELDLALTTLTTGLETRSDSLRVILARLHSFPQHAITNNMREIMVRSNLIFFIHILRIELADGGWTSKYIDGEDKEDQDGLVNAMGGVEERGPSDQAIKTIGDLLNCAVDAMGTSGWLVGRSGTGLGADELLESLRAEVSAGLEGCYEANALTTILAELEKCAASVEKMQSEDRREVEAAHQEIGDEKALLPLGSRFEASVSRGRGEKERKKSKMAIGQEKSRKVGKYSFERIRI